MKTFQVILTNGLTKVIEAETVEHDASVIDFKVQNTTIVLFRTATVLRVELFDEGGYHEIVFPGAV